MLTYMMPKWLKNDSHFSINDETNTVSKRIPRLFQVWNAPNMNAKEYLDSSMYYFVLLLISHIAK